MWPNGRYKIVGWVVESTVYLGSRYTDLSLLVGSEGFSSLNINHFRPSISHYAPNASWKNKLHTDSVHVLCKSYHNAEKMVFIEKKEKSVAVEQSLYSITATAPVFGCNLTKKNLISPWSWQDLVFMACKCYLQTQSRFEFFRTINEVLNPFFEFNPCIDRFQYKYFPVIW